MALQIEIIKNKMHDRKKGATWCDVVFDSSAHINYIHSSITPSIHPLSSAYPRSGQVKSSTKNTLSFWKVLGS